MSPIEATSHLRSRDIGRRQFLLDGDGIVLGRLATLAANLLRGKGHPYFSSHADLGDSVVVLNASKVRLTGNKLIQKIDFRYSGYRGGQTYTQYGKLMQEKPERAVRLAVYGMLPKNRLRRRFIKRLKVFRDASGREQYPSAESVDLKTRKMSMGGPFSPGPRAAAAKDGESSEGKS